MRDIDKFWEIAKSCPEKQPCWIMGADLPPYCGKYYGVVQCTYTTCPKITHKIPLRVDGDLKPEVIPVEETKTGHLDLNKITEPVQPLPDRLYRAETLLAAIALLCENSDSELGETIGAMIRLS